MTQFCQCCRTEPTWAGYGYCLTCWSLGCFDASNCKRRLEVNP